LANEDIGFLAKRIFMRDKRLISARELHAAEGKQAFQIFDCRFVLSDPGLGYREYLQAHIPGAVYAHLDDDLSGPVTVTSGRHPLPNAAKFAAFLARCGWRPGVIPVAYDQADGSIAARLWWLMKYFGHDYAVLLDGGLKAWQAAGYEFEAGQPAISGAAPVSLQANPDLVRSTVEILAGLDRSGAVLADVRAGERFRGEVEPIDPVAGHIPGAVSYPYPLNVLPDGRFKSAAQIRDGLGKLKQSGHSGEIIYMCGSGVTACHAIFAAELAGQKGSGLYAGSWSEWIRDPSHPVASGPR
jgi:thiosulfate/3-mercaptopyruvate sulfurtransferase